MKTLFRCQGCSRKLGVDDSQAGRVGNCPDCDFVFVVPDQSDPEFAAPRRRAGISTGRDGGVGERYPRRTKAREVEDVEELEEIEELEEEEPVPRVKKRKKKRKKTYSSGEPDLFLPLLLFSILMLSAGMALSIPFPVVAVAVFWVAWIIGMISGIWMLVIAFQEDPICLILNLLVPFYSLYYLVTRWSNTWKTFVFSTVSIVFFIASFIRLLAAGLAGLSQEFKEMHQKNRPADNMIFIGTPPPNQKQPWMGTPPERRLPGR